jgi:hypothetical protein
VNQTFARRMFGDTPAIGRHFLQGDLLEVVGVVEDGKYTSLTESSSPAIFFPLAQRNVGDTALVVRSPVPQAEVAAALLRPLLLLFSGSLLGHLLGVVCEWSARPPHLPGHLPRPSGSGRRGRDHDAGRFGRHLDSRAPRSGRGPRAIATRRISILVQPAHQLQDYYPNLIKPGVILWLHCPRGPGLCIQ